MPQFSVGGRRSTLDAAVAEAAKLLAASRLPLIAGLGADVGGIRAAVRLADRCGGVIDHMHSQAVLRNLDVMREHGMMLTTPNEARRRADTVLLVGPGLEEAGLRALLPMDGPSLAPLANARPRRMVVRLGTEVTDEPNNALHVLGSVRAALHGRGGSDPGNDPILSEPIVKNLRKAKFGVAVWSPASLDGLAIEMLCGLVKDLNAATRWSGLPLDPPDGAADAVQTCGWMTGFPMRTSFARGYPEHDPWQFDGERLLAEGEADCVVWISALDRGLPARIGRRQDKPETSRRGRPGSPRSGVGSDVPSVTLTCSDEAPHSQVHFRVGTPGIDHDGVAIDPRLGSFVPIAGAKPSDRPSVATILDRIAGALIDGGVS